MRRALESTLCLPRLWTAGARLEPDFVMLGAQKAGTTSLYAHLSAHPSVAPATRKEVHFFDLNHQRGMSWYRAHFPMRGAHDRGRVTGECSPYYLFHPAVPERLVSALPAAKLIVLLRNPVERAYSHYQHEVRNARESLDFEEACEREEERLAGEAERLRSESGYQSFAHLRCSYLARGRYAEQLEAWRARVPKERMLILSAEDYAERTGELFGQVCRFLGLFDWEPPAFPTYYVGSYEPMRPDTRQKLVEYFRPHNERLYALLGRDFGWDR